MSKLRLTALSTTELPDGSFAIMSANAQTAVVLNPTGALVAELCDGTRTEAELVSFLCSHLERAVPEIVEKDVGALLDQLRAAGCLASTD